MAVSAAFIADFTSFTAATQKATLTLKTFESGATQVEKALNKVGNAYSGQRTLQQAVLATKAVTEIGGATKLTEKEQQRLNATLTEAIAKYGALGQQAPADMLKLEAATRKVEQSSTLTSKAMGALTSTVAQLAAGFGIATLINRGVSALVSFGKEAFESAGRLVDLSAKTGLTTETLQRMEFAAKQSGGTLEGLADASFKLGIRLSGGSGSVRKALDEVGLSFGALQAMNPSQQFEATVAALGRVEDATKRNELGVALFGKVWTQVASVAAQDWAKVTAAANVSTDAQLKAMDKLADEFDAMIDRRKKALKAFLFEAAQGILLFDKDLARQREQMDQRDRARSGFSTATAQVTSFVDKLKEAEKAARSLNEVDQAELNAALKLGDESAEDLENRFFAVSGALKAYQDIQADAVKVTKDAAKATKDHAKEMKDAAKAAEEYTDAVHGLRDTVSGISTRLGESFEKLDLSEGRAELREELQAHQAFVDGILAKQGEFQDEQAQAQADAIAAGEVWAAHIGTTYRTVWDDITDQTLSATGDMLTGLRSFKDGAIDIWRSLQQAVSDILNNILRNYLNQFLGKMAAANASFGGAGGGGGGGVASLFGGGGGGAAGGGGGGGTAAAGGFGKFGTGAVAGGIAGLSVGYASGSKTAGALAGAGTGALTGFQFGGVYGAAIGAGVGLAGGLIGGAAGARKERLAVQQARLEWMKDAADDIRREKGLSAGTTDTEAIQSLLGMPPGTSTAQRLWKELNLAKTLNSFSGAVGRIQNYAQGLEAERMKNWKPSTFEEAPAGTPLGQWFTGSRQGQAFHSGGMVPGTGQLNATLLGGEGVASHRGMKALAQLNAGGSPGTSQAAVDELRRLRAELAQLVRDLPRQLGVAQRSAMALAGRTA